MPQVIVIDEIGTELEAQAARTIAERGVQLIGTAHGNNLDNLMLNPTLSDLIGGIQSVTLGDEEARRRRTQKSVLERKAPPTFDVIIEIQDRERVMVHSDVADTVDAMLRGDPVAPELRWRDEEGVHRSQARPRPSPREQLGAERFAGLVGSGSPWRMEPGWRGDGSYRGGGYRDAGPGGAGAGPGYRAGYRPGASGGWRQTRGGSARETGPRGRIAEPGAGRRAPGSLPGERFAVPPAGSASRTRRRPRADRRRSSPARSPIVARSSAATHRRPSRAPGTLASGSASRRGASRPPGRSSTLKADEGTGPGQCPRTRRRRPGRRGSSRRSALERGGRRAGEAAASCGSKAPAPADPARPAPRGQPQAPRAGGPRAPAAGRHRPRCRRGRRRHDPPQRVPPEDTDAPRGRGPGDADLRPQEQHDPPDAGEPDLDLLARGRPPRGRAARDRGGDRAGPAPVGGGRAAARRTPTSGGSSTRWPSGPTSSRARAVGSRTGACGCTRTRRGRPGADPDPVEPAHPAGILETMADVPPQLSMHAVVLDCPETEPLVAFWSAALGYVTGSSRSASSPASSRRPTTRAAVWP